MSTSLPEGPADEREFHRDLTELIRTAVDNDVDVRGGWSVDRPTTPPDEYGIEIYRVSRDPG